MFKSYETELAGRKLVIETGKLCGLANGKRNDGRLWLRNGEDALLFAPSDVSLISSHYQLNKKKKCIQ